MSDGASWAQHKAMMEALERQRQQQRYRYAESAAFAEQARQQAKKAQEAYEAARDQYTASQPREGFDIEGEFTVIGDAPALPAPIEG